MFYPREAIEALEYPPVVEQIKKRCRWLHRFSTDTLAKLPGSQLDPFDGTTIDINSLGEALSNIAVVLWHQRTSTEVHTSEA